MVLYELLTGRRPFEKDNATALAIAHVEETPEPPSAHVPDLDPAIDALVMKSLAKDPDARFEDGAEFAWALETPGATAMVAPVATDDATDERPVERNSKRILVGAALVGLFVALLAFGVFAVGRDDEPERARFGEVIDALPTTTETPTPTPTPTEVEEDYEEETSEAVPVTTPTPTPTPTETESPSPSPTSRPTSTPTSEPTTEPTTEPTSEPTATATP